MRPVTRRASSGLLVAALLAGGCVRAAALREAPDALPEDWHLFNHCIRHRDGRKWGGAVQSRVFSVGNGVLSAEAGVGVVATQAVVDVEAMGRKRSRCCGRESRLRRS